MFKNGYIVNEFGEKVGSYWYNQFATIDFIWCGLRYSWYTEEGFNAWLDRLEYYRVTK